MPRISRVTDTFTGLEYGYLYDIQSISELHDWYTVVRLPRGVEEFADASRSKEGGGTGGHATKGAALAFLAGVRGSSLVDTLANLNVALGRGLENTLERDGRVFINANGGYFGFKESLRIEDTRLVFAYQLPSETIRIFQWPNGKHYYAKLGGQDVVIDGVQKWDTWDKANAAAHRFIEEGKL